MQLAVRRQVVHSNRQWILSIRRYLSCSVRCQTKNTKTKLPSTPARTRFAPSPTGFLHLGSLRTALFNYLLAKKTNGQFLLRVEDTDQKRTVPGAERRLYADLQWAGLQWDEGPQIGGPYGPYKQSERTKLYKDHAQKLLETGHAYRCFCSVERLDQLARQRKELGLPTDYDRQCEGIDLAEADERAFKGESHTIRLRAPESYPAFNDLVYGKIGKANLGFNAGITHKHGEIAYEDPVLLKSDGHPTYHLANVVDDHLMQITHVIRGTEWISSTPKHLALYEAFGWTPPEFAHVGLLVDEAGHKLSKRNMDIDISSFKNSGVLSESLINFAALLGWSHDLRSDVLDLVNMVSQFQMKFTKGNATVTMDKLWFLQKAHADRAIRKRSPAFTDIIGRLADHVEQSDDIRYPPSVEQYLSLLLPHDSRSYTTPMEFIERNILLFNEPDHPRRTSWVNPASEDISLADLEHAAIVLVLHCAPNSAELLASGRESAEIESHFAERCRLLEYVMKALMIGGEGAVQTIATLRARRGQVRSAGLDGTLAAGALSRNLSQMIPLPPKLETDLQKARYKALCSYLRWVFLDSRAGPGIAATMALLGRERCSWRLESAGGTSRESKPVGEDVASVKSSCGC